MNQLTLAPEISASDYHSLPGVSASRLKVALGDIREYHYQFLSGEYSPPRKDHFDFGSAVHEICLLGAQANIVVIPDEVLSKNGSRAGGAWKQFAAENAGKLLLKGDQMESVLRCVRAVHDHPLASELLAQEGYTERTFTYHDPDLELTLRCRPDKLLTGGDKATVLDLKTSETGTTPGQFAKAVANYRYDCQEAFYRRVLERLGIPVRAFVFIAVSVTRPHTVDVYTLSNEFRRIGEADVENCLAELAERHRANDWLPRGYGSVVELAPPNWHKYRGDYEV